MSAALLETRKVDFLAGEKALISEVTFSVRCGEVVALLGPNGAGKSTLLKVLCGQLKASRGEVFFESKPLADWPAVLLAQRRAVLPQASVVPFEFTALEIVLLGRSPHGDASTSTPAALEAMEWTDCAHLKDRIVTTLSGGEMQRVQLARVLVQIGLEPTGRPRCLMLDEPVSNLDPRHQHEILRVANRLASEGVSVVVVLHDLNLAAQYADRLVLMKGGRIVAEGGSEDVLTPAILGEVFDVKVQLITNPVCDKPAVFVRNA